MVTTDSKSADGTLRGASIPVSVGRRRHSRFYGIMIGWLKVVFPTIAILLLAVLILWPYLIDDAREFSDSLTNARALVTEHLEVNEASYAGVGKDGQRYNVTAATVQQASSDATIVEFQSPQADIGLDDGSWVLLSSKIGQLDKEQQILELWQEVSLYHDLGYEFSTESATVDLVGGDAFGFDPVSGQGPFGSIEADGFEVHDRGAKVLLTGPARVILYDAE